MRCLLAKHPSYRPTLEEVVQHPWLQHHKHKPRCYPDRRACQSAPVPVDPIVERRERRQRRGNSVLWAGRELYLLWRGCRLIDSCRNGVCDPDVLKNLVMHVHEPGFFTCRMCATKLKHDQSRGCCRCHCTDVTILRMQDQNVIWKGRTLHLTCKITIFMLVGEVWGIQKRTQRGWPNAQKAFFAVGKQLTAGRPPSPLYSCTELCFAGIVETKS